MLKCLKTFLHKLKIRIENMSALVQDDSYYNVVFIQPCGLVFDPVIIEIYSDHIAVGESNRTALVNDLNFNVAFKGLTYSLNNALKVLLHYFGSKKYLIRHFVLCFI